MATQPIIKPEWLEIISCCSAKVQNDLIRAIVAWQADATVPDFRGAKKAIFLIMVRDLDPTAEPQPDTHPEQESQPSPAPDIVHKRKNSPRYFCGRPLY